MGVWTRYKGLAEGLENERENNQRRKRGMKNEWVTEFHIPEANNHAFLYKWFKGQLLMKNRACHCNNILQVGERCDIDECELVGTSSNPAITTCINWHDALSSLYLYDILWATTCAVSENTGMKKN